MEFLLDPWPVRLQRAEPGVVRGDRAGGRRSTPRSPSVPSLGLHQLAAADRVAVGGAVHRGVLHSAVPANGSGAGGTGRRTHPAAAAKIMEDSGLNRQWIIAVKLSGPFAHFHPKKVSIKWKPLLWFVKGEKTNSLDYISDFIESKSAEKLTFEWEQNTIEAEHVISRLTVEAQTVCDPMMGEGTTGVAATKLDRRFIGIEINQERFDVAKARISKASLSKVITDNCDIMDAAKGGS